MPGETIALGIEDRFSNALTRLADALDQSSRLADNLAARLKHVEAAGGALRSAGDAASGAGVSFASADTSFGKLAGGMAAGTIVANAVMGAFNAVKDASVGLASASIQLHADLEQTRIAFTSNFTGTCQACARSSGFMAV